MNPAESRGLSYLENFAVQHYIEKRMFLRMAGATGRLKHDLRQHESFFASIVHVRKFQKEFDKHMMPIRCEAFRGVSESLVHHIVNDSIRDWVLYRRNNRPFESTPDDPSSIGDYNVGGDARSSRTLPKKTQRR